MIELYPASFGYCYWDSFDSHEIIGVCHTVTLSTTKSDSGDRLLCHLPDDQAHVFSWLDPNREEAEPAESVEAEVEECPNSPKVSRGKKRNTEKRAHAYEPAAGELLYCPESHTSGRLLLRPDNSFAYVHNAEARFSEGVTGVWSHQADMQVKLEPTGFGYLYAESFDAHEIVGVCHCVSLSEKPGGIGICSFSGELLQHFSWLDPTLQEVSKDA